MFRRTLLQLTFLWAAAAGAQVLPPDAPPPSGDFAVDATGPVKKIPEGVLIVKGAEPSASDHVTAVPEEGFVTKGAYQNRYFGLSWPLPADWEESFKGPLPSDHGAYVLANVLPSKSFKSPTKGTILFTAQDIFFSHVPGENAKELVAHKKDHLEPYYDVEHEPREMTIAGHTFARFDYESKVAGIHWTILATDARCHALQFVITSRDPELIAAVVKDMDRMTFAGGEWPACVPNYAHGDNVIERVEPQLKEKRFNDIPVRMVIDKRGRVKYVHVISAFPEQSQAITDALMQWKFKPYLRNGQPAEVETGLMFGGAPDHRLPRAITASKPAD
jgi:hypothetical protein